LREENINKSHFIAKMEKVLVVVVGGGGHMPDKILD
jgi:hypothetical protein